MQCLTAAAEDGASRSRKIARACVGSDLNAILFKRRHLRHLRMKMNKKIHPKCWKQNEIESRYPLGKRLGTGLRSCAVTVINTHKGGGQGSIFFLRQSMDCLDYYFSFIIEFVVGYLYASVLLSLVTSLIYARRKSPWNADCKCIPARISDAQSPDPFK